MKLLLDTNAFIWWREDLEKLSVPAQEAIFSAQNSVFVSVASIWELQIKILLGKLTLVDSIEKALKVEQETNNLRVLSLDVSHILGLATLPRIHKDPFDRILVSQAINENMTLITSDSEIRKYNVDVI